VKKNTHFGNNLKVIAYFVEYLTKLTAIVRAVHLYKAKYRMLKGPLSWRAFLNPVPCDGKIRVSITCLPRVASQADFPTNCGALMSGSKLK
jgi:hypothetical protein